jgi:hypothetical protein
MQGDLRLQEMQESGCKISKGYGKTKECLTKHSGDVQIPLFCLDGISCFGPALGWICDIGVLMTWAIERQFPISA